MDQLFGVARSRPTTLSRAACILLYIYTSRVLDFLFSALAVYIVTADSPAREQQETLAIRMALKNCIQELLNLCILKYTLILMLFYRGKNYLTYT